jgi:hypothetical protein
VREEEKGMYQFGNLLGHRPDLVLGQIVARGPFSSFFFFSLFPFSVFSISSLTSSNLVQIGSNQFLKISKIQGNKSGQ